MQRRPVRWASVSEVARWIGQAPRTVRWYCARGALRAMKSPGGSWRVDIVALERKYIRAGSDLYLSDMVRELSAGVLSAPRHLGKVGNGAAPV